MPKLLVLCHFNINISATECPIEMIFSVLESSEQELEHIEFTKKSKLLTLNLKVVKRVPMEPKISFPAVAQKRRISCCCRFLTFTTLPPRIFWHAFEKNYAPHCTANVLGSLGTFNWPPTRGHSTKMIFHIHVTFDLWWVYVSVSLC